MPKTIIKQEIPYQMKDGGMLVTTCPYLMDIRTFLGLEFPREDQPMRPKVGSAFCMQCKHHVDHLRAERIVICKHPLTD